MKESLLQLFGQHPEAALLISLGLSIGVALLGIVPSFFITAANLLFFGFWKGTAISFLGEALGAIAAFLLYRNGFRQRIAAGLERYPRLQRLVGAEGSQAFGLIFSLRLLPFMPSGLVTFAAAVGRVGLPLFALASSLGKLPALLLEAYAVWEVGRFSTAGKVLLVVVGLGLLAYLLLRKKENPPPGKKD
jgi:uncharacterized membrane protein YdjX (TVP38/TMEM64 family)